MTTSPDPPAQTSLHPGALLLPEQQDAEDYSPILKRPRHSTGPLASPLPCRQSPTEPPRHNGEREPWLRPTSPKHEHESKYEAGLHNGDNKSLLSQALEKREQSREERDDSNSDTTGSERAGSASIDTVKSDMNSRDGVEPPANPIFPPGLEALYRQAGFPPFLNLGGHQPPHLPPAPVGPSTTHIGLQSHAANPTSKHIIKY